MTSGWILMKTTVQQRSSALLDLQNTRAFFEKEYSETAAGTKELMDALVQA